MVLYLYKRYTALYISMVLLGFFGLLTALEAKYPARDRFEQALRVIVIFLFSVGFAMCSSFVLASAKNKKAIALLTEECDPYAFLEEFAKLKPLRRSVRPYILLNMAAGYANIPNWPMCQTVLQQALTCSNKPLPPFYLALYYHNLADFYVKAGQFPLAVEALQNMENQINQPKFPKNLYNQFYNMHLDMVFMLNLAQGRLEGVEIILWARFNRLKERQAKVITQLLLAKLYRQTGEAEKQRQALAFVLQNGNKLVAVQEAGQMLAELDGTIAG